MQPYRPDTSSLRQRQTADIRDPFGVNTYEHALQVYSQDAPGTCYDIGAPLRELPQGFEGGYPSVLGRPVPQDIPQPYTFSLPGATTVQEFMARNKFADTSKVISDFNDPNNKYNRELGLRYNALKEALSRIALVEISAAPPSEDAPYGSITYKPTNAFLASQKRALRDLKHQKVQQDAFAAKAEADRLAAEAAEAQRLQEEAARQRGWLGHQQPQGDGKKSWLPKFKLPWGKKEPRFAGFDDKPSFLKRKSTRIALVVGGAATMIAIGAGIAFGEEQEPDAPATHTISSVNNR